MSMISLVTDPAFSTRVRTDAIGLLTGQVGYAWNQALLYVKGGGAVTGNRFDILSSFDGTRLASADATRWGAAVGVGFEYGFTPGWSVETVSVRPLLGSSTSAARDQLEKKPLFRTKLWS